MKIVKLFVRWPGGSFTWGQSAGE